MNAALDLERPQHLQDPHWTAIETMRQRLVRAVEADDKPQIIGCCKDLAESVAKIVVEERGHTTPGAVKYPAIITQAHLALERQPGDGITSDGGLRCLAQGLKTTVTHLAEIRNELGTGHGRAVEPHVHAELAQVCVETTMLWVRWALRRLGFLIYGAVVPLIADLNTGTFTKGVLASRLEAANLPELDEVDQRRLGVAVGRRTMQEATNLVRIEGVKACIDGDLATWPDAYRRGVADGLLVDANGYLTLTGSSLDLLPKILSGVDDPGRALTETATAAIDAPPSPATKASWGNVMSLLLFRTITTFSDPTARAAWKDLCDTLRFRLGVAPALAAAAATPPPQDSP